MDLKSALRSIGLRKVEFGPGDVCIVKDGVIEFPDDEGNRTDHAYRTVVILTNDTLCASVSYPLVTVAPTSHLLKRKNAAEVIIDSNKHNGFDHDSRIMLGHIQTLNKNDIEKRCGSLSLDEWENVMEQIIKNFDRA